MFIGITYKRKKPKKPREVLRREKLVKFSSTSDKDIAQFDDI